MSILKVARLGHPALRLPAEPVSPKVLRSDPVQRLIDDMVETMREEDGVGLAATQARVGLRIAVVQIDETETHAAVPLMILVNPRVTALGEQMASGWEGCLSVPGLRGQVPRSASVQLEALGRNGRPYSLESHDFLARVIQHETDHLDGLVFLDRMTDLSSLAFIEELDRHGPGHTEEV
jgi:peptide deformylase